jgi:hypothetical protein
MIVRYFLGICDERKGLENNRDTYLPTLLDLASYCVNVNVVVTEIALL